MASARVGLVGMWLLAVVGAPCQAWPEGEDSTGARSMVERLAPERLEAVMRDARAYREARREIAAFPGLDDYRAIFHAHAGDSAHTGGTPEEILAEAKRAGVRVIFLSDHYRPPRDFMDSWRGLREGVLFVPGSEARGFLLHPDGSVAAQMDASPQELVDAVTAGTGMAFLSHIEDREDHSMNGLTGMEIYNRHADAEDDPGALRVLVAWMTDPDTAARLESSLERFPSAVFASQYDYPELYLAKWDRETAQRRVVGVAANDCHHNQVFLVKKVDDEHVRVGTVVDEDDEMTVLGSDLRPRLSEMTRGLEAGEEIVRFDFDPYHRSMLDVSTHILAPSLEEAAVREAVREGHVYVSHDWIADPSGFAFSLVDQSGALVAFMGDEARFAAPDGSGAQQRLRVELPLEEGAPARRVRVLRSGEEFGNIEGNRVDLAVEAPGIYRVEVWLELDGEERVWIYSNPIYVQ